MDATQPQQNRQVEPGETFNKRFNSAVDKIFGAKIVAYLFMMSLLVFILVSGYVLYFSGSLFIEAVVKGWWKPDATEFDSNSFFYGYLFGFPSLCGVIGGIIVLSTSVMKMFRFKILFFVPTVVWTTLLVLDIVRRPMEDWYHWFYLVPALLLSLFILLCVIIKVRLPYLTN